MKSKTTGLINPSKGLIMGLILTIAANGYAAQKDTEDLRKRAVLIISAIKNSQWLTKSSSSHFAIGIVGNHDLYSYMSKAYQGKTKDGKEIVFRDHKSLFEMTSECQTIYLDESKSDLLDQILLSQKSVLIITSKEGLAKKGSGMNFIYRNGRLQFELNKKSLERSDIQASSEFLQLAIPV